MYVYCMVCYRVILAPYVKSVGHVFAYLTLLMTIRNALWTMRLLYSLTFFLALQYIYSFMESVLAFYILSLYIVI